MENGAYDPKEQGVGLFGKYKRAVEKKTSQRRGVEFGASVTFVIYTCCTVRICAMQRESCGSLVMIFLPFARKEQQ